MCFPNTTILEGDWELSYKTFGKKVVRKMHIYRIENSLLGRSNTDEFQVGTKREVYFWEMPVNSFHGSGKARFEGMLINEHKLSGILIISEYPLSGRAIRWKARKIPGS